MMPTAQTSPSIADRSRSLASDIVRRRALQRLYEQKAAVDELISSLELYQNQQQKQRAKCVQINAAPKCSSGSVQSRI
jgi:hypothetical protein